MSITPIYLIQNVLQVIRSGNSIQSHLFGNYYSSKNLELPQYPTTFVWEFNGNISKRPKLSLYPIYLYVFDNIIFVITRLP